MIIQVIEIEHGVITTYNGFYFNCSWYGMGREATVFTGI